MDKANELKGKAKRLLKKQYLKYLAVSILPFLTGGFIPFGSSFFLDAMQKLGANYLLRMVSFESYPMPLSLILFCFRILAFILYSLGIYWIVMMVRAPLTVGYRKWIMTNRKENAPLKVLFHPFKHSYLNTVKCIFTTNLIILISTVFFIFPGIYMAIKYRMVPYILAENPATPSRQAREQSAKMTEGKKWSIATFDLSFCGWFILALLVGWLSGQGRLAYLAFVFLAPYYFTASAELYLEQRGRLGLGQKTR